MNTNPILASHPCFSEKAHGKFKRLHLPLAPACNIQCRYCVRKYDCANESRPGVTSRVLTPYEAFERLSVVIDREYDTLSVIGIAGPGDPLFNEATFEALRLIHQAFPHLLLCVSTNGLLLPEKADELIDCGVTSLTVTINAVSANTAALVYSMVSYAGRRYKGREGAELLLARQWEGLGLATEKGLYVKVNTVLIPGINQDEIIGIAKEAAKRNATIMNILPLIPQGEFAIIQRPDRALLHFLRKECSEHILQMNHCTQCRADAFGIIGEDKDMEFEVLMAHLGEEYCQAV